MAEKQEFPIKRGDLLPTLVVTLLDGTTPVDLTAATSARFLMRSLKTGLKVDGTVTVLDQTTSTGKVEYEWADGDTDTVGVYQAEIEVLWPGNKPQTFPANGYFSVKVVEQLDEVVAP